MKIVILAGGFGTRLSEHTTKIPKPLVPIGDVPIIFHIMSHYSHYGFNDFIIALGYKSELIKDYFVRLNTYNSDFDIDLKSGNIQVINKKKIDWKIKLVDTGLNSMTGGRLLRVSKYINSDDFMLTYGDGVSDVNIVDLFKFHKSHNKIGTVTAVHPIARFGELEIKNELVSSFKEKPQVNKGWINGGFFVFKKKFIDYLDNDSSILEKEPLEMLSQDKQLHAFKHNGFWQCMDNIRDKTFLDELISEKKAPWKSI